MRFPVFGRGSNPSTDRPIQHKKMSYLEDQVRIGNSDWVDPAEPRQGIVAREILHFGCRPSSSISLSAPQYSLAELPGVYFVPPKTSPRPPMAAIRAGWDWSAETAMATA